MLALNISISATNISETHGTVESNTTPIGGMYSRHQQKTNQAESSGPYLKPNFSFRGSPETILAKSFALMQSWLVLLSICNKCGVYSCRETVSTLCIRRETWQYIIIIIVTLTTEQHSASN